MPFGQNVATDTSLNPNTGASILNCCPNRLCRLGGTQQLLHLWNFNEEKDELHAATSSKTSGRITRPLRHVGLPGEILDKSYPSDKCIDSSAATTSPARSAVLARISSSNVHRTPSKDDSLPFAQHKSVNICFSGDSGIGCLAASPVATKILYRAFASSILTRPDINAVERAEDAALVLSLLAIGAISQYHATGAIVSKKSSPQNPCRCEPMEAEHLVTCPMLGHFDAIDEESVSGASETRTISNRLRLRLPRMSSNGIDICSQHASYGMHADRRFP